MDYKTIQTQRIDSEIAIRKELVFLLQDRKIPVTFGMLESDNPYPIQFNVHGVYVPVVFDSWGREGQLTVRVGWAAHAKKWRTKRDGSFDNFPELAQAIVAYAENEIRVTLQKDLNEKSEKAAIDFLESKGLPKNWAHAVHEGFRWTVNSNGAINFEMQFAPGQWENFWKMVELARSIRQT